MMQLHEIDVNCDLGEGMPWEGKLFPYIDSCSIACGGHIGDKGTISRTLKLAVENGVRPGAHPSYPDKEHFGRISMNLSEKEFKESMKAQLEDYFEVLDSFAVENHHIKAHGALYNDLARDERLCGWFIDVIKGFEHGRIYTTFNGILAKLAQENGLAVTCEAFIDRNYNHLAQLVSREELGAIKHDSLEVWGQMLDLITHQKVKAIDGSIIPVRASTFCVHGDRPEVLENLRVIRYKLNEIYG